MIENLEFGRFLTMSKHKEKPKTSVNRRKMAVPQNSRPNLGSELFHHDSSFRISSSFLVKSSTTPHPRSSYSSLSTLSSMIFTAILLGSTFLISTSLLGSITVSASSSSSSVHSPKATHQQRNLPTTLPSSTLSHSISHAAPSTSSSPPLSPSSNLKKSLESPSSSTVYFESKLANYTIQPGAAGLSPSSASPSSSSSPTGQSPVASALTSSSESMETGEPKASFSWKSPLHLSPASVMSKGLKQQPFKLKINPNVNLKYANQTQTSASSQSQSLPASMMPQALPFHQQPGGVGGSMPNDALLSQQMLFEQDPNSQFNGYQGLVQPADHFQNSFFMSSQIVDPLLDQGDGMLDPQQGGHPILMDYMHMKDGNSMLFPGNGQANVPGQAAYFSLTPGDPGQENFAIHDTAPEIYHKSPHHYKQSMSHTDYGPESKNSPVAQNMLFVGKNSEHQSYYTPFKFNTINVYAKYLTHGGGYGAKCSKKGGGKNMVLSMNDIKGAVNEAAKTVERYEATITNNALETKRKTPYIPSGVLDSIMFEYASAALKKRKCFNKMDVITILPKIDVSSMVSRYNMGACKQPQKIQCDSKAKYPSIDGSCNNLKMKSWGKSFTCHRRLLPPDYADGIAAPRIAYDGGKLPNAREISQLLLPDMPVLDHKLTSMVMAFGQFVIHDITRTLPTSNDIKCCPSKTAKHPECIAIDINRYDDPLFQKFNQTCINMVRSIVCNPCSLGPREQQNQATHTFDMSHQYGLRLNDSLALRTMRGGKLRSSATSTYPKEELPPKMQKEDPSCNVRPVPPRFKCFLSADGIRASQHPALQALHTAFHRRHNMHTDMLAKVNPHWDDEKLYQEARRITTAEQSKMIYGEYLPAIFGKKLMKHFRLGLNHKGYTKYDPKLNPSTIQEFIVAAGRFGHSQINDQFRVLFKDKKMSYSYNLRDNFFETTIVSLGHSGGILKGMAVDATEATDPYFVDDIRNQLYHLRREKFGRDLPAFNIQRGREHGIPGYVFYLDFCFGFKVKAWKDLVTFIPMKQLKKIQTFYKHYKDIDIFVGGISERLIAGAAFGPTFACINGIQFYNFKFGDRFYFEHGYQSGSFTPAQLDTIKKSSSVSAIICHTHPEVGYMPENSMIKSFDHYNPMKPCHSFPEINYLLWMDKKRPPKYQSKGVTRGHGGGGRGGHGGKGKSYGGSDKASHSTGSYGKGGSGSGSNYNKKAKEKYKQYTEKYYEDPKIDEKFYIDNSYHEGPHDEHDDESDSMPPSHHADIIGYMKQSGAPIPMPPPPLPPLPPMQHQPQGIIKMNPMGTHHPALHSSPQVKHQDPFIMPPTSPSNHKPTIIYH